MPRDRELAEGPPADQGARERGVVEVGQLGAHGGGQLAAQEALVHGVGDPGRPRVRDREGLDEQVREQQHLHTRVAQEVGEGVVLELGALHPGDAVEEQPVGVARGQALELRTGTVQHDAAQSSDLAVHPGLGHGRRA